MNTSCHGDIRPRVRVSSDEVDQEVGNTFATEGFLRASATVDK